MNTVHDERVSLLQGGRRQWWDVTSRQMVSAITIYVPFGCPDWGETNRERNGLCTFCALPNSVQFYRSIFYDGAPIPDADHIAVFARTLQESLEEGGAHTVMIFNAGSFLAMPRAIQESLVDQVANIPGVERLVIEARAPLITEDTLLPLLKILEPAGIRLTVRVGVETQDDHLRLKVLKKGHSRAQLLLSAQLMKSLGVTAGGYVLLNPAPGLDPAWAEEEARATIEWVLGPAGLAMDEVYFGATCVGPNTPLALEWEAGNFAPPTLRSVYRVLSRVLPYHAGRVHLLPFVDVPSFLSVPSNHVLRGIPESLEGAEGCDLQFHHLFKQYRATMDHCVLKDIPCSCST
jgi:radical SAM enzyme (TIGR01210 family)